METPVKIIFHYHSAKILAGIIASVFITVLSPSCENDIRKVQAFSYLDTLPGEMARDIEILYSDSGRVQIKLTGPLMVRKMKSDTLFLEFPEGFTLFFFTADLRVKSKISANYGISNEKSKIMEARNRVEVVNTDKNEKLNTERLVWDRNERKIFSDAAVQITRPDNILYGDGLVSEQDLSRYDIKNIRGEITVNDDKK